MALATASALPSCAVGNGNGYTAALIATPAAEVPPPKPVVVATPQPMTVVRPHRKRAKLTLGCASHKKG